MQGLRIGEQWPPGRSCADAGQALADSLRFDLIVTDLATGASIRRSTETLASLTRGALLASQLTDGDCIALRLTASLPFQTTGNPMQYGSIDFALRLALITVAGETEHSGGSGGGGSTGGSAGDSRTGPGHTHGGSLVIGGNSGPLASTGAPVSGLMLLAAGLLLVGLLLLLTPTKRNAGIVNSDDAPNPTTRHP